MNVDTVKEIMTISDKELLSKKLTEEVEDLKIQRGNLETQINTLERQKKAEYNVSEAKYQEVRNRALIDLADEKSLVSKERMDWKRKNERITEQQQMMEKNQKEVGNVKDKMEELQKERMEIYTLRKEAEELTRKAKEQWGEIEGFKESQEAMKQDLESKIKNNEVKYKYLMDSIGEVEEKLKAVSIRESNCKVLEMKFDKEVKNDH